MLPLLFTLQDALAIPLFGELPVTGDGKVGADKLGGVKKSLTRSKLTEPIPADVTFDGVAFDLIHSVTCAGDALLFTDRYAAATPATCGEAIEVPLIVLVAFVEVNQLDVIEEPGAKISKQVPKLL